MKTLILGIVVVFCAQLAFIGYTFLDRPIDTASVTPVSKFSTPTASFEPDDTIMVVRSGGPAIERPEFVREITKPTVTVAKRTVPVPRKNYFERSPEFASLQQPIVITYRTGTPIVFRNEYPLAPTPSRQADDRGYTTSVETYYEKPKKEKKNFASRTQTVLKKPYDWLKAIGTKLK
jgi:hypothetical protein